MHSVPRIRSHSNSISALLSLFDPFHLQASQFLDPITAYTGEDSDDEAAFFYPRLLASHASLVCGLCRSDAVFAGGASFRLPARNLALCQLRDGSDSPAGV